ncbi:RNA-binding domain-containing protein [Cesiribacter andamanensis]|uniref:Divergent AAA domain protein n=1 Tax=Cesiribacter andamanensis AMV16 TaxID=1279009 RepID=M7NR14_9BACT|nr:RNA-binding domain-containing protein [Cesiribacter andamanensis]EMR00949.1 Divergent AAA domain protein [Cesiribacter andamanensis AMV16]
MQHNLAELLRLHEGEQLDFKQRISSLEKIARTLCAFANTRGGLLLVGVSDDRSICGTDPEEEKYMLEQAATDYCNPPLPLQYQELEDEEGRTVLLVQVQESAHKPHACRNQQGHWQVYVRLQDKSIPAGPTLLSQLERGLDAVPDPGIALSRHEKSILAFIELHKRITLKQLMILLNFSRRRGERLLHDMENRGLVRRFEHERQEYFA